MNKYRTTPIKNRKKGKPFLLLLTAEEHEYLERIVRDRGGKMSLYLRSQTFPKGWRRKLDDLRREQGHLEKAGPL